MRLTGPARAVPKKEGGIWTVILEKGTALFAVRKPSGAAASKPSEDDRFRLKTRGAVMGVRGTDFYASIRPDGTETFCLCEGKIEYSSGKDRMPVSSKQHDFQRVLHAGAKPLSERLQPFDLAGTHSDEELAELHAALTP